MRAAVRRTFSRKRRWIISAARTQIGMLTKKIHRHDTYSLNTPPRVGPITEDMPHTLAR